MAKRKGRPIPNQGQKHRSKLLPFIDKSTKQAKKALQNPGFTKYNFKLSKGVPLFRLDTMETIEL